MTEDDVPFHTRFAQTVSSPTLMIALAVLSAFSGGAAASRGEQELAAVMLFAVTSFSVLALLAHWFRQSTPPTV